MGDPDLNQPIIILSDLHIGHSASGVKDVNALRPLFPRGGTLIFNGDTVEQLSPITGKFSQETIRQIRALAAEVNCRVLFITGNHDPDISDSHHLLLVKRRILVTHGHVLFDSVTPWSKEVQSLAGRFPMPEGNPPDFEELTKRANSIARAMSVNDVPVAASWSAKLALFFQEIVHPFRPFLILRAWAVAPAKAELIVRTYHSQVKFVIIGHTHFPGIWKRGDLVVINTGSFSLPLQRSAVRIQKGKLEVVNITRSEGRFCLGKVRSSFELSC